MSQQNGVRIDQPSGHLVQLLLPIRGGAMDRDRRYLDELRTMLTEKFGGATAYVRAPAIGDWKDQSADEVERDEIVIVEVMTQELEPKWWGELRESIRKDLDQEELIVRALPYIQL